ncbi:hypothetical protein ACHAXR_012226 [Thalassiosira sp. AJA248-18]
MSDPTPAAHPSNNNENAINGPQRFIYNQADMEHFRHSSARKELLSFVSTMGRGLTITTKQPLPHGGYHPHSPLENLTPALASLHGSLSCISSTWMDPNHDGIPPDHKVKARFGNPAFRTWHERLVERSYGIVRCLMDCHVKYSSSDMTEEMTRTEILKECSEQGYRAASSESPSVWQQQKTTSTKSSNEEDIITELRAYLHDAFGHPIRIDYGTGHESSFIVFLLSLCKIGCYHWGGTNNQDSNGGDNTNKSNPPPEVIGLASLSLFHAYLNVTRGLQRDYMLEPAGSHGVWGLDDYHCVPFYLGACQMMAREQCQQQNQQPKKKTNDAQEGGEKSPDDNDTEDEAENRMPDNPYLPETTSPVTDQSAPISTHNDNHDHWTPSVIHDRPVLEAHRPTYLYLSCIHFIQQIKPNVPFFESSPMLNDISHLGNWSKVSTGLLRLYEGEVINKMPVVQHFLFGKLFSATWSPSRKTPLEAPKRTFINGPMGEECIAPWAYGDQSGRGGGVDAGASVGRRPAPSSHLGGMPPTRAPWAK